MFKKRRGIKLPYNEQGLIYFTCMNIKYLSEEEQQKILNLCREVAGEYAEALYIMLTDDTKNVHAVALQHYTSESQLYRYRNKFYDRYKTYLIQKGVLTERPTEPIRTVCFVYE